MKFENRAIIKELSLQCNWKQLKDHFSSCSDIVYVTAHKIPETGTIQFESQKAWLKLSKNMTGQNYLAGLFKFQLIINHK